MADPLRRARADDPTVYPVEERVGEGMLQRWMAELLRPLVERWLGERGRPAFVGADQFIYYRQHDPHGRVAPDVYVLPGVAPDTAVTAWKVWERAGIVPSFALEIVSQDWLKDYAEAPDRYAALGAQELVIFDPEHAERDDGLRFQVYRWVRRRGTEPHFVRVEATNADRIRSRSLGAWLHVVGAGAGQRLRLAVGPRGEELVPTDAEIAARERARAEYERARADAAVARLRELEKAVAAPPRSRRPRPGR